MRGKRGQCHAFTDGKSGIFQWKICGICRLYHTFPAGKSRGDAQCCGGSAGCAPMHGSHTLSELERRLLSCSGVLEQERRHPLSHSARSHHTRLVLDSIVDSDQHTGRDTQRRSVLSHQSRLIPGYPPTHHRSLALCSTCAYRPPSSIL